MTEDAGASGEGFKKLYWEIFEGCTEITKGSSEDMSDHFLCSWGKTFAFILSIIANGLPPSKIS